MRRIALIVLLALGGSARAEHALPQAKPQVNRTGLFGHEPFFKAAPHGLVPRTTDFAHVPAHDFVAHLPAVEIAEKEAPKPIGRARAPKVGWQQREMLSTYSNHQLPEHEGQPLYKLLDIESRPRYDNASQRTVYHRAPGMGLSNAGERAIAGTLDLDPQRKILTEADWQTMRLNYGNSATHPVKNADEHIDFLSQDNYHREHALTQVEERVRGALAKKLVDALAHETPSPDKLAEITDKLAVDHPYLANPWKVEMLIADMRRVQPTLGAWDFRTHTDGKAFRAPRKLPESTQAVVSKIGYRALEDCAVVMTSHLYRDALVMSDALEALGADPHNMHFVATPYPFDPRVKKALSLRGVSVQSAPYDKERTRQHVVDAVKRAVESSTSGPILVLDDGGLATEVIAKEFPSELHRFRIVEVTKAGERVAKTVLPYHMERMGLPSPASLPEAAREKMHEHYLEAHSWDPTSRAAAEQQWAVMSKQNHGSTPETSTYGFSYTTYSNTAYKRDVMTPLYTEQVNQSMFASIARSGKKPANNRITIIGGGAMGLAAARELRDNGHEVTFVEPEAGRASMLANEGFTVEPLAKALPGRSIILEMSGVKNIVGLNEIFRIDDGAFVLHGSSKDNPFDMKSLKAMASKTEALPEHNGQRSMTYTFSAAGRQKSMHFLGDGFTISHGGKPQNVPLEQFLPELNALLNIGVHEVTKEPEATRFPYHTATDAVMQGNFN